MKTLFLSLAILLSLGLSAQYCGHSSPTSCAPDSSLTAPGLTDYHNFPCVSRGVAFSEAMQLYVPATVTFSGFTVTVDSVHIDSITNLPCGLCWSANKASLTYSANERGCMNISGTSLDTTGTYSLGLYGTAYTALGAFPGSLNTYWGNFYIFVKNPNDACNHAVGSLMTACGAQAPCTMIPQVVQVSPSTPCASSASITLTTAVPYTSQLWTNGLFTTTSSTFIWSNSTDYNVTLRAIDSAGCSGSIQLVMTPNGATGAPQICYFTSDTSLTFPNVIVAGQRNDYFHTASFFAVYASDSSTGVGGSLIGMTPASQQAIIMDSSVHLYYSLQGVYCSNNLAPAILTGVYSKLTVDSTTTGYPQLTWPLQLPVTYTSIYVMAREQGSSWQVIDSIFGINGTNLQVTYIDHYPTATHIDYMLGYNLDNTCDPSRSGGKTVFTNAAKGEVRSALVTTRPSGPNGISGVTSETFLDLYPNPVTGMLHIQLTGTASPATIAVYDMLGNAVYTTETRAEQVTVDMSGYAQGIYLIKASQQGKLIAIKKVARD